MNVKGSAVLSTQGFIKSKFPDQYDDWLNALSPDAKKIFMEPILPNEWYPMKEGLIEPTQKLCEIFYNGDLKGAWDVGRYSAEVGLKRFYRIFLKFGSPHFLFKRASTIFSIYYAPSKMIAIKEERKSAIVRIIEFPEPSKFVEARIAGWIERALELMKTNNPVVKILKSLSEGDEYTEIMGSWD